MSYPNELVCQVYLAEQQKALDRILNTIDKILKAVSEYQGFNILSYSHKNRDTELVDGRKAYAQLCIKYIDANLTQIGAYIDRQHDHMIYYNKCEYPEVKQIVNYIENNYTLPNKLIKLTQGQKRKYERKTNTKI